jgi:hypothetical protein
MLPISPWSPPRPGQTRPRAHPDGHAQLHRRPLPQSPRQRRLRNHGTIWVDEAAVAEFPRRARRARRRELRLRSVRRSPGRDLRSPTAVSR